MTRTFMIDIETTGLQPDASILQVAILEMIQAAPGQLWTTGDLLEIVQFYGGSIGEFGREHQMDLYARCLTAKDRTAVSIRSEVIAFTGGIMPVMCGWNASSFDLPRLKAAGWMLETDYSYRVYEMSGAIYLAADILALPRDEVIKEMKTRSTQISPPVDRPQHDAVMDCYQQVNYLNGLINLVGSA